MRLLVFAALLAFNAAAAETEVVIGRIFPDGTSIKGEPAYVQRTETTTEGGVRRAKAVIKDQKGDIVMTESAMFKDGVIIEQDVEQKQIQERYQLRAEDGRTIYRTFKTKDGKEKLDSEKSEKTPPVFLTGPGFQLFLLAHQKKLLAGEKVEAQFGAFELGRSVGFDFQKTAPTPGSDRLNIRMAPSSIFLKVIISPILLGVDTKTMRLAHYKGRTPLRNKIKNSWEPFDAEIEYVLETGKP